MPELPEVETIARTLAPAVEGRCIAAVSVRNPGTWQGGLEPDSVCGCRVTGTGRRGKVLLVALDGLGGEDAVCTQIARATPDHAPTGLAFHLKMSGRVFVFPAHTEPGVHTRVIVDLNDGSRIFFDDARKFGYVRALNAAELTSWPFWQKLGPEPLSLHAEGFAALFAGRGGAIKALLLDQTVLAGVGNIYADESLFRAGIRPDAAGKSLSAARLRGLHTQLVEVLEESITACGSSIRDYRTARGDAGSFQNAFKVYGRAGEACTACGAALCSGRVAGRTTVWCAQCQQR